MIDQIKKRRSIRKYTEEAVSESQITAMLEAAMAAPSANNKQPWEFVVVQDKAMRKHLADMKQWSYMCANAPVVFVICGDGGNHHWVEDASAATENLLLAAAGLDLGGVWIAVYPEQSQENYVRQALDIPERLRVLCMVAIGHPAETKTPHTKYDEAKVHFEKY
jgi:nitroreductase